jgi:hypothetical protein
MMCQLESLVSDGLLMKDYWMVLCADYDCLWIGVALMGMIGW